MNIVYDIETYPNFFCITFRNVELEWVFQFEISERKNDFIKIKEFLAYYRHVNFVGFNNIGFDYPVLHWILQNPSCNANQIYDYAMFVINSSMNNRFGVTIWERDWVIPQIDLFKIHHFDNPAKRCSLKQVAFWQKTDRLQGAPIPFGTVLNHAQMDMVLDYNDQDTIETAKFFISSQDAISLRKELSAKNNKNYSNLNDTKIGDDFFITRLEKRGIKCYRYDDNNKRSPIQTIRKSINLNDAILSKHEFKTADINRVLEFFRSQTITETKGVFKDVSANINGFIVDFGSGGLHGSVSNRIIESNEDTEILDIDVKSFYPNVGIQNRFYPEHLTEIFCDVYQELFNDRSKYPKGSGFNAALKLALNGVYGNSNNEFSPFFDSLFTMKITLNGQFFLCRLIEKLGDIDSLEMIQANTDGITVKFSRKHRDAVMSICKEWEAFTKLELEYVSYKKMCIRDVNNYIAVYMDGDTKRKGAYEWKLPAHKNNSELIVAKVAEKVLVDNVPIRKTVMEWKDIYDFFVFVKCDRSSKLLLGDEEIQNTNRMIVTKNGKPVTKIMPPTKKKPDVYRRIGQMVGYKLELANDLSNGIPNFDIDYEYYINEVEKLTLLLG